LGRDTCVNAIQPLKVELFICDIPFGNSILFNALQLVNALYPIDVSDSGREMYSKAVQLLKALLSICNTPFGNSILFNALQLVNALSPIDVSDLGRDMLSILSQFINAQWPISVIPFGTSMSLVLRLHITSFLCVRSIRNSSVISKLGELDIISTPSSNDDLSIYCSDGGRITFFNKWQWLKALPPIYSTLSGSVMLSRLQHIIKAPHSIVFSDGGSDMFFSELQSLNVSQPIMVNEFGNTIFSKDVQL
jgi:hypothetical protein